MLACTRLVVSLSIELVDNTTNACQIGQPHCGVRWSFSVNYSCVFLKGLSVVFWALRSSSINKGDFDAPLISKFSEEFISSSINGVRCNYVVTGTKDCLKSRGNGGHSRVEQKAPSKTLLWVINTFQSRNLKGSCFVGGSSPSGVDKTVIISVRSLTLFMKSGSMGGIVQQESGTKVYRWGKSTLSANIGMVQRSTFGGKRLGLGMGGCFLSKSACGFFYFFFSSITIKFSFC
mmetsp:Transcript_8350/g.20088  ORF Transcript_8350/g.20088 Transcript_8350/m.20088 type:complete len:233 (+) Transcript_8350:1122-1820(+)